jgi:hypothetical protein
MEKIMNHCPVCGDPIALTAPTVKVFELDEDGNKISYLIHTECQAYED